MISIWKNIVRPSGFPVSENKIKDFENSIGFDLPADYRNFLLRFNGGKVIQNHEIYVPEFSSQIAIAIYDFLPFTETASYLGIQKARSIQEFEKLCMRQAICIGDDNGTGFFYLILAGERRGAIYFSFQDDIPMLSDEEWESDEIKISEWMAKVSPDFDSLADVIMENPPRGD